ncbi:GIY-YIG nuclease family protein [Gemmatimonas sp.]
MYALYRDERLYYVGLASNMLGRLTQHMRDRHQGRWDRFSAYLTTRSDGPHIRELEALLLRIVAPQGNRVGGRLRNARDLSRQFRTMMAAQASAERDDMLAKRSLRQDRSKAQQAAAKKAAHTRALRQGTGRRTLLKAEYKGDTYSATLLADGQVRVGGKTYASLTAAAKAATGRTSINGRHFWKARHKGEWCRLSQLN